MDLDSIRPILSGLAGAVIALAIQAAARRGRPRARDGFLVLRYPGVLRILSGVCFILFSALTVRNAIYGSAVNSYAVALLVPLALAIAGGCLSIETSCAAVLLGEESLEHVSPWRRNRRVAWRDVVEASYSSVNSSFDLRTRFQGTVRVSTMLVGADALLGYLRQHGIELKR